MSLVLAFLLLAGYVQAATITSTGTGGVWTAGSSWLGGVAPGANDDAIIVSGATVTIDAAAVVNNLTINNGGTLIVSGTNTLTVNGSWTNNGIFTANSSTVVLGGSTDVSFSGNSPSTFYNLT
ncbi:MAG: hypothetical protein JNL03_04600, partial [Prolixibacteraceae bacterium]|nr:hypothetical protein [Prolixibacteraceae bacterium]